MLYHENLRRDLPNPDAAQYRHPPLRGITQRELEGLTSFLQLLTAIITWVCHKDMCFCLHITFMLMFSTLLGKVIYIQVAETVLGNS